MGGFEPHDRDLQVRREREQVQTLSTRDVSDLVVSLDADDEKRRASAAWSLAEVAATTPERIPISDLTQALSDDDRWVRRGATWALAEVAQNDPAGARPVVQRAIELVDDGDPLVRENAVVTVAGVASEFPREAEPAIDSLVELRDADDGVVRQYASEALRHVVDALSSASLSGDPVVISVRDPELAGLLPDGPTVVQVGGASDGEAIRIAPASAVEAADGSAETPTSGRTRSGTEPPSDEAIASPPPLSVAYDDFERLGSVGQSPLVTVHRAHAVTPDEQHAVVSLFTARADCREEPFSTSLSRAFDRWGTIDDHDHVLAVRAHGESPTPWAATEFTDGGTLADYFDADLDLSLWVAHCIVRAVSHAHALGVVHGGLCPPAVRFVTTFGPTWPVPKVGDWGFAAIADHPSIPPAYAAPEHVAPESFGILDHSTDVYGLGTLLYGLLTGYPPFAGEPHVVAGRVPTDDPPVPTDRNPNLPEAVDDLLARALAKRKPERYETVDDLRVALERCIETSDPELMGRIY